MLGKIKEEVIELFIERDLTYSEKNFLVQELKSKINYIETSVLEAYFDITNNLTNSVDLRVNSIDGRYYFHIPTGWILALQNPIAVAFKARRLCKRLYFRSFISVVYDKLTKNKTEYNQEKVNNSRGLKKLGYRMIFCLSRKDEKSILLAIARHISVLSNPIVISSMLTKTALVKARRISHQHSIVYPNIYFLDRQFKNLLLEDEITFYKRLKKILQVYSKVIFVP